LIAEQHQAHGAWASGQVAGSDDGDREVVVAVLAKDAKPAGRVMLQGGASIVMASCQPFRNTRAR